jgi:hypothetical protein
MQNSVTASLECFLIQKEAYANLALMIIIAKAASATQAVWSTTSAQMSVLVRKPMRTRLIECICVLL